jgi:hypothetical protein
VLEELLPDAWHHFEQHANNPIEADHSQLKHWLRPMPGLRTDRTAQVIIAWHAFIQNLRRGHHEIAVDVPRAKRLPMAFTESPWRPDKGRSPCSNGQRSVNATAHARLHREDPSLDVGNDPGHCRDVTQ